MTKETNQVEKEVVEVKTVLIVSYKKGIKTEDFKEAKKGLKFKKEEKLKFTEQDILVFDTEEEALEVKKKLENHKNVKSVSFDRKNEGTPLSLTNEPLASDWNYHMKPNPNIPNDNFDWLELKRINDNIVSKPETILAIIDDGVKTDHPDLVGKLVDGYSAHQDLRQSQGGVVYIPNQTHGTLVVGMAVARTNNGRDASSIGGIFDNVKVLPISIYDPTGEYYNLATSFVRGINHAISRKVTAISISWGGFLVGEINDAIQSAYNAGIALFLGAGNNSSDNSVKKYYPAVHPAVYAIGNVNKNMTLNSTSNYGNSKFVGNGSNVIRLNHSNSSFGAENGGTSSATPHVASIYTAIKAVAPSLNREKIISIMSDTAYDLGNSHKFGDGYPNAVEAIRMARILSGEMILVGSVERVASNKTWTINLSGNADSSRTGGVYVVDSFGKEHPTNVVTSGATITITPTKSYVAGGVYFMVVSDLYNTNGVRLSNSTAKPFMI